MLPRPSVHSPLQMRGLAANDQHKNFWKGSGQSTYDFIDMAYNLLQRNLTVLLEDCTNWLLHGLQGFLVKKLRVEAVPERGFELVVRMHWYVNLCTS